MKRWKNNDFLNRLAFVLLLVLLCNWFWIITYGFAMLRVGEVVSPWRGVGIGFAISLSVSPVVFFIEKKTGKALQAIFIQMMFVIFLILGIVMALASPGWLLI